jgi:alpha-beta hydrolase superfamily lysophospholipase
MRASGVGHLALWLVAASLALLGVATAIPALSGLGLIYAAGAWLTRPRPPHPHWGLVRGVAVGVAALAGAVVAGGIGLLWWRSAPPVPDGFYDAPAGAETAPPGTLLRREPFTQGVPDGARGWRILYTTTRDEGVPAVASAVILAPPAAVTGPRPVVAWTHGTTGAVPGCAPTVLPSPQPFDAAVPAVPQLLAEGWILVGTDYVGLGSAGPHPYLIGQGEGRSALDAVRAARTMAELSWGDRTVVWGHSQGGHAALWTGGLAPAYAPDVNVVGVAAMAPASDLPSLVAGVKDTAVGKIMLSFVMAAYSSAYPDVRFDDYVGPRRRGRAMASRCLSGPGALLSVATALTMGALFAVDPSTGPLAARLDANVPRLPVPSPLLIAQGRADTLVLPDVQDRYVQTRCDAGQPVEYRTYQGRDHLSVLAADSPLVGDLIAWTRDRFAGAPGPDGCRTLAR